MKQAAITGVGEPSEEADEIVDMPRREPAAAEVDGRPDRGGGGWRVVIGCLHVGESRTITAGPQCGFGGMPAPCGRPGEGILPPP